MLVSHNKENDKLYAAKRVKLDGLSDEALALCRSEVDNHKKMAHKNIVSYKESFTSEHEIIIVMEYCEGGDLSKKIREKRVEQKCFSELEIFNWFVQICEALKYIHSMHVLHRDLKPLNIFLTSDNTVKLGDFGVSKAQEATYQETKTKAGTE